jgi:hypothetical protein
MNRQFASVWYVTHEKFKSMTKFIAFSDRGSLDVSPDQIEYRGKKYIVSMPEVSAVSLASQRIPWVTYAIVNVAAVACFAIIASGKLNVGLIAAILIAGNLLGVLIVASMKWVMVEYQDESNQIRKAYFADGSLLGWGGIFGGTAGLYRAIKQQGHADV